MAVKNRKGSTNSVVEKSKKSIKRAQKDINNTSMATSKYGAALGILIILFGIIYVVIFGNYIYKRKTGHPSALNQQNPNPFANFANIDMDAFRKAIKVDENGKVTFSEEDLEKFKEIFVDVNGNAQVPPKDNGEENVEEVGNENENENVESGESAANAEAADAAKDEKKKKLE
jgi:hypothetical protein